MHVVKQVFKSQLRSIQSVSQMRLVHDYLKLEISGESLKFPHVWLRDNCQCEQCFHSSARSRIFDWSKFDLKIKPKEVVQSKESVEVTWSDGHTSLYTLSWLKFRNFTRNNLIYYNETIYKPAKKTWNKDNFNDVFAKFEYDDVLKSDKVLYDWLYNLSVYGVALIQNTPKSDTALDAIVKKVGFPKRTHYGAKFIVQNVPNTSNVAYLSSNLQMHVDLPYYEYCPGTNLLHCLVQTESNGGDNLLSDSHYVADYMKENNPDAYKLLTEVEVEWSDIGVEHGNEFFKLYRAPVICLDKHGEIIRINFSIPQRGSYFPEPSDKVVPWYEAHGLFLKLSNQFAANFKTKEGNILVFDNIRMLHGRNAYSDSGKNVRKLIGAYIDWDEVYSRLRCLTVKLKNLDGI